MNQYIKKRIILGPQAVLRPNEAQSHIGAVLSGRVECESEKVS